jgi:endonuclease/exonuclease/phosphatase (EEP) superfamily protein YafD
VRLRHRRAGREFALANLHAGTSDNQQQLERAGWVLEQFARGAPMVLAGDLNATARSPGMRSLRARGWFEDPEELGRRIDHILVRGMAEETRPTPWEPERRDLPMNGRLPVRLSDHDPIDSVVLL